MWLHSDQQCSIIVTFARGIFLSFQCFSVDVITLPWLLVSWPGKRSLTCLHHKNFNKAANGITFSKLPKEGKYSFNPFTANTSNRSYWTVNGACNSFKSSRWKIYCTNFLTDKLSIRASIAGLSIPKSRSLFSHLGSLHSLSRQR